MRFRNVGEVKAWNDAMVAKYDLDRFHAIRIGGSVQFIPS